MSGGTFLAMLSAPVCWLLSPATVLLRQSGRALSVAVHGPLALMSRLQVRLPPSASLPLPQREKIKKIKKKKKNPLTAKNPRPLSREARARAL